MSGDSTKKLYLHGLAASLVYLGVVSVYSLTVIRLSLLFLGKEEFGLISLLAQVSAYIAILDLGLYLAFSRILVDFTNGSSERYANALRTANAVFHTLGLVGFAVATAIALWGKSLLSIPPDLENEFTWLMIGQGALLWVAFAVKPISAPVVAAGKHYVVYWCNSVFTILNVVIFWGALKLGFGIYSSIIAQAAQALLNAACIWKIARSHRMLGEIRGKFDRSIFKEVVAFARDSMLWQVGGQTLASLPIILASMWFALTATADISAGMKLVLLLISVTTRFGDMSVTPLSIEHAKGNETGAARQMARIVGMSGGVGVCAAIGIICVNPPFISWWMLDEIHWAWHANLSCALWVAILSVGQCLYGYAVVCKQLKLVRWALLLECLVYLVIAAVFGHWVGPASLLWAKPAATLVTGVVVGWRIKRYTAFDTSVLLPGIVRQGIVLLIWITPCLFVSNWIAEWFENPVLGFIGNGLFAVFAAALAFPFLFNKEMRGELLRVIRPILIRFKKLPV